MSAADLLARLEACGARLAVGEGDTLTLTGKRPSAALLEEVKARKPDVLAHLRAQAVPVAVAPGEDRPAQGVQTADPLPARPDWVAVGAQPGRCGSCSRAVDASSEWGEFMVTCSCESVAWWPTSPPLAVHVGALCGAYLTLGEEIGRGWRAKGDGKAWGPLRPVPLEVSPPDELLTADHEGAA